MSFTSFTKQLQVKANKYTLYPNSISAVLRMYRFSRYIGSEDLEIILRIKVKNKKRSLLLSYQEYTMLQSMYIHAALKGILIS